MIAFYAPPTPHATTKNMASLLSKKERNLLKVVYIKIRNRILSHPLKALFEIEFKYIKHTTENICVYVKNSEGIKRKKTTPLSIVRC
jgi:hypothetical protein